MITAQVSGALLNPHLSGIASGNTNGLTWFPVASGSCRPALGSRGRNSWFATRTPFSVSYHFSLLCFSSFCVLLSPLPSYYVPCPGMFNLSGCSAFCSKGVLFSGTSCLISPSFAVLLMFTVCVLVNYRMSNFLNIITIFFCQNLRMFISVHLTDK
jgi:hypothetical protein